MIIEMKKGAIEEEIRTVIEKIESLGFQAHPPIRGKEKTVIAVLGSNTGEADTRDFEVLPGVEGVTRIQKPFKLASRDLKKDDTVIRVGDVEIGGKEIVVMAGPCAVESEEQILSCAMAAKENGAVILRGGAFKPRTSPFSHQGLKEKGLKLLSKAREKMGLLIVTEVVTPEDVGLVSEYADILQIGARNMQNYQLLGEAGKSGKPILLKRGLSATIEEWLQAADYILRWNSNPNVILCLRGIRTFDNSTRFTFDVGALPVIKHLSHLPVIVDPSHAAGNFRYVPAYAKMAIVGGADGLIVEMHPDPKKAVSDGAQSLTFSDFSRLTGDLKVLAESVGRTF